MPNTATLTTTEWKAMVSALNEGDVGVQAVLLKPSLKRLSQLR